MPRFKVTITRTFKESAEIEIEAEDRNAAHEEIEE